MPDVLRFGIRSLDELLGRTSRGHFGIRLLEEDQNKPKKAKAESEKVKARSKKANAKSASKILTTSVCIIGPNGAGKSIFGLHMASRYLADCRAGQEKPPSVLYVSTDLTNDMAQRAWKNFALDYPFSRKDPFYPSIHVADSEVKMLLEPCEPTMLEKDFDLLERKKESVVFVDIASYTAGDDWGFLHKLLSLLPVPTRDQDPRHLVVVDAIEGFEALAGDLNAFGEKSTRRSRIAQVMRLAATKCHVLLVVEESTDHEKNEELAEQFVADSVIRLENFSARNYDRRVLKVEKVRGQSHTRGQHHYSIRSGSGSTTGGQANPDDPEVLAPHAASSKRRNKKSKQSYVHVYHSVHRLNRTVMELKGTARHKLKPNTYYSAFGIKYLDNMLGGKDEITNRIEGKGKYRGYYHDTRGLPSGSTTAFIGDSLTQKSTLGRAFLSRCFRSFDIRLRELCELMKNPKRESNATNLIWEHIQRKVSLLSESPVSIKERTAKQLIRECNWQELSDYVAECSRFRHLPLQRGLTPGKQLTHLAAWLLDYRAGLAVMLVTHNTHHEQLAEEFIGWLHSKVDLKNLNEEMPDYERALKDHIKGGTICRRLEIHSLSSEVLVHIVHQVIRAAQRKLLTLTELEEDDTRYERSWPIRVVIDDLSTFRDIFPELREDPLLLPSILFHFEREGVTTLIVDTQSGRPDTPIAERFESELRKMVHHNLYTWRVPFYGESRVAITAIPPLSAEYAGIVRELRWESESLGLNPVFAKEPAIVDPHLELYTGLEEGNPQPVPLRVLFYAETPAMEGYVGLENRFLTDRFVPPTHGTQTDLPSVIVGVPPQQYEALRDFAYLQTDTRLDHTLVFQVDEFWAMRAPDRRKRAGAFQPQSNYLNAITAEVGEETNGTDQIAPEDYEPDPNVDPYGLFQLRQADISGGPRRNLPRKLRRRHFYEAYYRDFPDYEQFDRRIQTGFQVDRVPFSWDFGFLLCQEKAWYTDRLFTVDGVPHSVRQVWDSLTKAKDSRPVAPQENLRKKRTQDESKRGKRLNYVSWRLFIQACKKAAERQSAKLSKVVTPFDFAQISPESFSCLILEMWFSEIYDRLLRQGRKREIKRFEKLSQRGLFHPLSDSETKKLRLAELLETYWLELYKTWLLLIEVLNFSEIVGDATALDFDFKSKKLDFSAVASRHWYKTASQCPDEIASKEPLIAVRLPGHFSVRGDWFLAISGGSRSIRQAERALDLLSSRRANVTRLQLGIGLPTRGWSGDDGLLSEESSLGILRTRLVSHQRGQEGVPYGTFLKIQANNGRTKPTEDGFYWLWRDSLHDYAHWNRIWHKWLYRALLWWHRQLLRYKSVWINSFDVYDRLTNDPPKERRDFAPHTYEIPAIEEKVWRATSVKEQQEQWKKFKATRSVAQLKVRAGFMDLLTILEQELQEACEASHNLDNSESQQDRIYK